MTQQPYETESGRPEEISLRLPHVGMPQPAIALTAPGQVVRALPWRRLMRSALAIWLGTRALAFLLGAIASLLPQAPTAHGSGALGNWQRFDTNWYIRIATEGYHIPQQVAFFPLYPALISVVSHLTGGHPLLAALLVSNLAALAAFLGVGALTVWETRDVRLAPLAMLALAVYPFSFFLAAGYTESLCMALAAFCLLSARRGAWLWAAALGFLSMATRPTGIVLAPALAWEWGRQSGLLGPTIWEPLRQRPLNTLAHVWEHGQSATREHWRGLLAIAAAPLFLLGFTVFIGARFHHPSLIVNVRRDYWDIQNAPPWTTFSREIIHLIGVPFGSDPQVIMVLDLLCIVAVVVVTLALWRRQPFAFTLYMLALLYLATAQPNVHGVQVLQGPGRYLLASIPLFVYGSEWLDRHRRLGCALGCVCLTLHCYIGLRFLSGVLVE